MGQMYKCTADLQWPIVAMSPLCLLLLLTLTLVDVPGSRGACPLPADLKKEDGTRTCAKLYDKSDPYYDNCCQGAELSLEPGTDLPYLPSSWANKASSLVVGTRCELTVWSRPGKEGKTRKFSSGSYPRLEEYRRGIFGDWANSISGLYCKHEGSNGYLVWVTLWMLETQCPGQRDMGTALQE
ncbi:hypothetical protein A6R68_19093 [Neotoma lepida]|uniref:Syncollin n=1 Tax=Neotoma lepida TaxID=56216 RepID=A0A1A6HJV2_NEOLE|nr:hypothetical protein A6R68_19093 [Neotoma lepida]